MKRVYIALGLLAAIIALSACSLSTYISVQKEVTAQMDHLDSLIEREDYETLAEEAKAVSEGWNEKEHLLIRFIRHQELDEVTSTMTRLPMLAKYLDLGELSAEINHIRVLLHHILDSEIPYPRNVF
ncbi:MAG: DUF4363 family protein [Oscillospiraceae bacterium]|nr:DUF4363 family protein [Oscillospiraceae bacterium]